jgi:hypothetical protein
MRTSIKLLMSKRKGFLDVLGAKPSIIYSLRKVNDSYNGALIKVQRSSDNLKQDIFPSDDGSLNESQLLSFIGNSNGLISVWYDQISGINITQDNSSRQPKIAVNGIINKKNGRPSILFSGNCLTNLNTGITPFAELTVSAVFSVNSNNVGNYAGIISTANEANAEDYLTGLIFELGQVSTPTFSFIETFSTKNPTNFNGRPFSEPFGRLNQCTLTCYTSSTNIYFNGIKSGGDNIAPNNPNNLVGFKCLSLGGRRGNGRGEDYGFFEGNISEAIFTFGLILESDRQTVDENQIINYET